MWLLCSVTGYALLITRRSVNGGVRKCLWPVSTLTCEETATNLRHYSKFPPKIHMRLNIEKFQDRAQWILGSFWFEVL
jgi:hypothetical protein